MIRTLPEALLAARSSAAGFRFLDRNENASWYSYGTLAERALAVGGRLRALGVRPGERVGLVYPTSVDFIDALPRNPAGKVLKNLLRGGESAFATADDSAL